MLGLEQSSDTTPPTIGRHQRFKPFAEDVLPSLTKNNLGLLAHPYAENTLDEVLSRSSQTIVDDEPKVWLAIGPEGGFIPYEIEKLEEAGMTTFNAGQRVMRTETAVPYLLALLGEHLSPP